MSRYTYMLRTCAADMTAYGGFLWPTKGPVSAPDWSPDPVCGNGLHGALHGKGDGALLSWDLDAKWLVVRVLAAEVVDLDGKVKVPRGTVVYCGDRMGATAYLAARGFADGVIGGTATAGDCGGIALLYWTGSVHKRRCAEVGEGGLKPNVAYKLDAAGKFVEAEMVGKEVTSCM